MRTTGTFQSRSGPSASTALTSRIIVLASGCSALLTQITSGISITPAFSAWIESPEPGISASTIVSAWSTTSISPWPTPTVSSRTSSLPEASISSAACSAASASPPSEPRVAIERMNTPGSRKWSERRIRSPSTAPWVNGLEGSIESTPTSRSALRSSAQIAPIRVLLPTPGGPVRPTIRASPVRGKSSATSRSPSGSRFSTRLIARASARLSPATRRSASESVAAGSAKAAQSRARASRVRAAVIRTLRFLAANRMLNLRYARLLWRYLWRRLLTPAGWRWETDGPVFFGKGLELQIAKRGKVRFGRFVWIGDGTKIRCHEGEVVIGQKTVIGQECTISAYRRVRIGEQCVIADRAMFIDFDHGVVEVERPIRVQGIYMREVEVGSNVWIGYGACFLRGVRVGDNSIVGTNSVVTKDVPANAVVGGVPAKVIRMREAPAELRWPNPVEPEARGLTLRRALVRSSDEFAEVGRSSPA